MFLELLKNGKNHGVSRLYYTYQEGSGGIADALKLAEPFMTRKEKCIVILGDNYFEGNMKAQYKQWKRGNSFYMFDHKLWDYIDKINPSGRGELEITDVLKFYMEDDDLSYTMYKDYWSDMGTFESRGEVAGRIFKKETE